VRLNQAREDVQKYKSQLQKAQADAKVYYISFECNIITSCDFQWKKYTTFSMAGFGIFHSILQKWPDVQLS